MKLATDPHQLFHPRNVAAPLVDTRSLPLRMVDAGSDMFRWMEVDEAASLFLAKRPGVISTLGMMDGLVAAYDGARLLDEGRRDNNGVAVAGGVARIALGLGGALPGLGGAISEGILGGYEIVEGLRTHDKLTTVTGITQLGVSIGMGMLCRGIGGGLAPALILGGNAARVAVFTHDRMSRNSKKP